MNLVEALRESKATGRTYVRSAGLEHGWLKWDPDWTYKFSPESAIAEDWVPLPEEPEDEPSTL